MSNKLQDQLKQDAALYAVGLLRSGMVVGLGHGSTAAFAVRRIGEWVAGGRLHSLLAVPCSEHVERVAASLGIPLTTLDAHPVVDVTIDGADEVDPQLNLIKGRGGALLPEKIVAQASRAEVIVVDGAKLSPVLGTHSPVPIEVVPFGWPTHRAYLESLGAHVALRADQDGGPIATDQGNYLLDCYFGPIADVAQLAAALDARAGVVAHGLFIGLATDVIVARPTGIAHLTGSRREGLAE